MKGPRQVILVHGFGYDPRANSRDNPFFRSNLGEVGSFVRWERDLIEPRDAFGFGWYSVPLGWRGLKGAVFHGRWNRYRWAWDLAEEAGLVLRQLLQEMEGEPDLLGHSLGSRVILKAFETDEELPVRNVLFMNGAEFAKPAREIVKKHPSVYFTNLVVKEDDVLEKLDVHFAPVSGQGLPIGLARMDDPIPDNWLDIDLDDIETQMWGAKYGWHLQGDNPNGPWDHWRTYKHEGNWGLIQTVLAGSTKLSPPIGGV